MVDSLAKLVAGAKTPLALAGVVLFILYKVLETILGLRIFSTLTGNQTAAFMTLLVQFVFGLAVFTICLGSIGWMLQLNPRYRPSVKVKSVKVIPPGSTP